MEGPTPAIVLEIYMQALEMTTITTGDHPPKSGNVMYRYMYLKTYAKFTFCIKPQRHVSDENFLYYCIHLASTISSYSV